METRTSVKGVLYDTAGRPIKDAIVMIAQGPGSHHDIASVTNDSGEFFLSGVEVPGHYILQINNGGESVRKDVSITGDDVLRLQY